MDSELTENSNCNARPPCAPQIRRWQSGRLYPGRAQQTDRMPPAVARRFVEDMRAFHAEDNAIKRDEIAARQLHALRQHYSGKLRI
jgi:hypothetical protein